MTNPDGFQSRRRGRVARRLFVLALVFGPLVGGAVIWPESLASYSGTTSNTPNSLTVSNCLACTQLLGNPGFETGTASPWVVSLAGEINNVSTWPPATGQWDAALYLSNNTMKTQELTQTVSIPPGLTTATLWFSLHIETTGVGNSSTLLVRVQNASGAALATLATFPQANTVGYARYSYSVTAYIGQTIKVNFKGTTMGSRITAYVIDDTALYVG